MKLVALALLGLPLVAVAAPLLVREVDTQGQCYRDLGHAAREHCGSVDTAIAEAPHDGKVVPRKQEQCYTIPGICSSTDVADINGVYSQATPVDGHIAVYEAHIESSSVIGQKIGYLNVDGRLSKSESEKAAFTLNADIQGLAKSGAGTCGFQDPIETTSPFHCSAGQTGDVLGALDIITPTGQPAGQTVVYVIINDGETFNFGWFAKQADLQNPEKDAVDVWAKSLVLGDGNAELRFVWESA